MRRELVLGRLIQPNLEMVYFTLILVTPHKRTTITVCHRQMRL